jgi:hypothetical protein
MDKIDKCPKCGGEIAKQIDTKADGSVVEYTFCRKCTYEVAKEIK